MLLGFAALKLLPDRPAEAPWLSEDEKHALETKLAAEAETTRDAGYHALGDALTKPRVLVLALLYFCIVVGLYGIGFWMPQVIQTRALRVSGTFPSRVVTRYPRKFRASC